MESKKSPLVTFSVACKRFRSDRDSIMQGNLAESEGSMQSGTISLVTNHYRLKVSPILVHHHTVKINFVEITHSNPSNPPASSHSYPSVSRDGPQKKSYQISQSMEDRLRRNSSYFTDLQVMQEFIKANSTSKEGIFYNHLKDQPSWPVFDGVKNLYTSFPLEGETIGQIIMTHGAKKFTYFIKIQPAAILDFRDIEKFYNGISNHLNHDCLRALDIILRYGPSLNRIPRGDLLFTKPTEDNRFSRSKFLLRGQMLTVRPTKTGLALVIDRSSMVFFQDGDLLTFIRNILRHCAREEGRGSMGRGAPHVDFLRFISLHRTADMTEAKRTIFQLEKELKGLQVEVFHTATKRRFKIRRLTQKPTREILFDHYRPDEDGKKRYCGQTSVINYFQQEYGITLRYPDLPCVDAGSERRPIYLPMELCQVASNQIALHRLDQKEHIEYVKRSTHAPAERFELVDKISRGISNEGRPYIEEFQIDLDAEPVIVEGRVMDSPKLQFAEGSALIPSMGKWSMRDVRFLNATRLEDNQWVIINFSNKKVFPNELQEFCAKFREHGAEKGLQIGEPMYWREGQSLKCDSLDSVRRTLRDIIDHYRDVESHPLALVFVITRTKGDHIYSYIKRLSDTEFGLNSLCIVDINLKKCARGNGFFILSNLLMKFNAKLGGVACKVEATHLNEILNDTKTLIVGADVTHPGERVAYSISAAVGSSSLGKMNYSSVVRVQTEAKDEIIDDLTSMMANIIRCEAKKLKVADKEISFEDALPSRIIFYRDGVSDGQFGTVLRKEVRQMKDAFELVRDKLRVQNFEPKITFIVVQKRQRTRFVPANEDKTPARENVPSGTIVTDQIVQNCDGNDFFLCSHYSTQGTSRPCHYYVLCDENKFEPGDLYELTFGLCHTYVKCTKVLSIPPPVQYAHLAAFRARQYLTDLSANDFATARRKIRINRDLEENFYFI